MQHRRLPTLFIVSGIVLLAAWGGYKAWRVSALVNSLQARLDGAQALLDGGAQGLDGQSAQALVAGTRADVLALKSETGWMLAFAPALGWLPRYGGDVAAAPHLLAIADELTLAGDALIVPLAPLLDVAQPGQGTRIQRAVEALAGAQDELIVAQGAVQRARAERAQVDATRLSARTAKLVARLDKALPLLELGAGAGPALPDALGWTRPRTYLLLAQNDDELRPTGGFITALGILKIEKGAIADMVFIPSWAIDNFHFPYPDPPEPLRRFMGIDLWVLRDSNWSPDFPTSAREAMTLYAISQPDKIDGVVAVDQHMLKLLVGALGPFNMPGFDRPVTADTVIAYMREAWSANEKQSDPAWSEQHKAFIPGLAKEVIGRAQSVSSPAQMAALLQAARAGLDQRHLLIYLPDSPLAGVLAAYGWDGALRAPAGDALMVADWNAGYNKTSANVTLAMHYRADLSAAQPAARLELTYANAAPDAGQPCRFEVDWGPTYQEQTERCYWNYLRVFAAPGSELTGASRQAVPAAAMFDRQAYTSSPAAESDPSGRVAFANYLLVPRAQSVTAWFEYRLPASVIAREGEQARYRLYVQKQAGTQAHGLAVEVVLPPGARVLSADPAPAASENGTLRWTATLDVDRAFEVAYAP